MMEMVAYYQELSSYITTICSEVASCCQAEEAIHLQNGLQALQAQIQRQLMEGKLHAH